ncbi:hypothetical protein EDB19DRAFT_1827219 [Suillus lakei]|nr:hypothetical protein EDB19DRAFT_1827219 [Suillus lakei]
MATTNPTASSSTPPGESRPDRISSDGSNGELWHDVLPKNIFLRLCYKTLCMIAVSKSSVEHWRHLLERPIAQEWVEHKQMVMNRFENMNVTEDCDTPNMSVILSISTSYALRKWSYILQVSSFVAALISLMVGTSVLIIYDTCYANDRILKSLMQSRSRRVCCLILMAYPSLALAVSTAALMTAGFTSDKFFVKILTAVTYLTLIFLAMLAIYVFSAHLKEYVLLRVTHQPEN